jgi:PIN domain nuclease of toxin-antitoxin system
VRLLLDTHALLWWLAGDPLAPEAADAIADPAALAVVSSASIWEISIKSAVGKLQVAEPILPHVEASGFEPLPISWAHAEVAGALPAHHRDPFDRMLVAQAQVERLTLVTRDQVFGSYEVGVLGC